MASIAKELEEVLDKEEGRLKDDSLLAKYQKSSKEFDELVKSGVAKKRGYNLLTRQERYDNRSISVYNKF